MQILDKTGAFSQEYEFIIDKKAFQGYNT